MWYANANDAYINMQISWLPHLAISSYFPNTYILRRKYLYSRFSLFGGRGRGGWRGCNAALLPTGYQCKDIFFLNHKVWGQSVRSCEDRWFTWQVYSQGPVSGWSQGAESADTEPVVGGEADPVQQQNTQLRLSSWGKSLAVKQRPATHSHTHPSLCYFNLRHPAGRL